MSDELVELSILFRELDDVSQTIIKKVLVIMRSIEKKDEELLGKLRREGIPEVELIEKAKEVSLGMVKDARTIKNEIPEFKKCLIRHQPFDEDKFLFMVWSGDIYDSDEIEGIRALIDDLKSQLKRCTVEGLNELMTF